MNYLALLAAFAFGWLCHAFIVRVNATLKRKRAELEWQQKVAEAQWLNSPERKVMLAYEQAAREA